MKNIVKLNRILKEAADFGINIKPKTNDLVEKLNSFAQEESTISPKKVDIPKELLKNILVSLKINLICTQHAHWVAKGDSSYEDHLLFERLYNELLEEIDDYVERAIGLSDESVANPLEISKLVAEKMPSVVKFNPDGDSKSLINCVLGSEKYVLNGLEDLYSTLKESDNLTLGLDDLIMSMHSLHEKHTYLLNQKLK